MHHYLRLFAICLLFTAGMLCTGCTRHHAPTVTATAPVAKTTVPAPMPTAHVDTVITITRPTDTFGRLVVGRWISVKIETPQLSTIIAGYASQSEREEMLQEADQFTMLFQTFTVSFNADHTFNSVINKQAGIGKWTLDGRKLTITSDETAEENIFTIRSVSDKSMVLDFHLKSTDLLLTLSRQ